MNSMFKPVHEKWQGVGADWLRAVGTLPTTPIAERSARAR